MQGEEFFFSIGQNLSIEEKSTCIMQFITTDNKEGTNEKTEEPESNKTIGCLFSLFKKMI